MTAAVTPDPHDVITGRSGIDAGRLDRGGDGRAIGEHAVRDDLGERQVEAAGDMTGAHARPRFGRRAAESIGRARVHHLCGALGEGPPHIVEIGDGGPVQPRGERPRRSRPLLPDLDRVPGSNPGREPAIENPDVGGAEHVEHPPHPRRREQAGAVVHHDGHAVGDAQLTHRRCEALGSGQHVRQRRRRVPHRLDVDAHRTGDVPRQILRVRVPVHRRQVPGTVDDAQLRLAEVLGEPGRGHEGNAHPSVNGSRVPPVSSTHTDLFSVYSSTASIPFSRPNPLSPKPPNGTLGLTTR